MSSLSQAASSAEKRTNARYWIVVMLFIVTSFNYGDRATLTLGTRKRTHLASNLAEFLNQLKPLL